MRIDELKKEFLGYKQADVYRCVSSLEETFSQEPAQAGGSGGRAAQRS